MISLAVAVFCSLPDDLLEVTQRAKAFTELAAIDRRVWSLSDKQVTQLFRFLQADDTFSDPLLWRCAYDDMRSLGRRKNLAPDDDSDWYVEGIHRRVTAAAGLATSPAGRAKLMALCRKPGVFQRWALMAASLRPLEVSEQRAILEILRTDERTENRLLAATVLARQKRPVKGFAEAFETLAVMLARRLKDSRPSNDDRATIVPDGEAWHTFFSLVLVAESVGGVKSEALETCLVDVPLPRGILAPFRTRTVSDSNWGRRWLRSALSDGTTVTYFTVLGSDSWSPRLEAFRAVAEFAPLDTCEFVPLCIDVLKNRGPAREPESVHRLELEDVLLLRMALKCRVHMAPRVRTSVDKFVAALSERESSDSTIGGLRELGLRLWAAQPAVLDWTDLPRNIIGPFEPRPKASLGAVSFCGEAGVVLRLPVEVLRELVPVSGELPFRLRSCLAVACFDAGMKVDFQVPFGALPNSMSALDLVERATNSLAPVKPAGPDGGCAAPMDGFNVHRQTNVSNVFYPHELAWIAVDGTWTKGMPAGWPLLCRDYE